MIRATLVLVVVSAGCFFDASTGVQAPTKHGYGNWGVPLSVTIGGDKETGYGRIGAGAQARLFASPNNSERDSLAWAAGGLLVRNELDLFPIWRRMLDTGTPYYNKQVVLVATLAGGIGEGTTYRDDDASGATYFDAYVGAGIRDQRTTKRARWLTWSAGIAATRISLGDRDAAWFVGLAATLGFGLRDD